MEQIVLVAHKISAKFAIAPELVPSKELVELERLEDMRLNAAANAEFEALMKGLGYGS
jgi:hypothetical protein